MTFFANNIARSATGKAFISIRDNDLAAEVMGVNSYVMKLRAFMIASFYAGIAGALWASVLTHITADSFSLDESIWFLGMVIIGGMGHVMGAFFGAAFMISLGEFTKLYLSPYLISAIPSMASQMAASLSLIIYSLAIIIFLIFEPRGINHRWEIIKNYYRLWPYSYK
jgi:branched-chain amino acid transport system permease protein